MVERLRVTDEDSMRVAEDDLREVVRAIFLKCGVPDEYADQATDVLVTSDLRGVESHGVSNSLRGYVQGFMEDELNPAPQWKVLRETPATANIDSDRGLGIVVGPKAMEIAIEKALNVGVGVVTIRNSRHLGMISYHAMMALEHDMIGMAMSSCPANVNPTFGAEARFGTNPLALAAPADREAPFVFDAAMSIVPANKLILARRLGVKLLPGWTADENGTPVMHEVDAPPPGPDGIPLANLLPLGSTMDLGSHKGYGLMAIVDILGGILSGGGYGLVPGRPNFNHYVAAYDVEAFMDTAEFKRTMDEWLYTLRTTRPSPGHDRVVYAGLREAETVEDRRANGIPLHIEVIEWFRSTCSRMGIPFNLA